MESGTTRQPSPTCLPLSGASANVFPIYDLQTYGQSLLDPIPSRIPRPCLFGFSQPFPVRRRGCRPVLPLYELPRTMRSKQRYILLLNNLSFNLNHVDFVCQGSFETFFSSALRAFCFINSTLTSSLVKVHLQVSDQKQPELMWSAIKCLQYGHLSFRVIS